MNKSIEKSIKVSLSSNNYIGRWYNYKENWGDAINPFLVNKLFKKNVFHENEVLNIFGLPVYSIVGSIINVFRKNSRVRIWGSGVANPEQPLVYIPEKIYAVRGPKTLKYLNNNKIKLNNVDFGDPVLLIDRIYEKPQVIKKYKVGIIKHYADKTPYLDAIVKNNSDFHYINILRDMKNPFSIVDEIVSCENIVSSSLHGLVLSDVYKIPNVWVSFNNRKNPYKYLDYYESIGSKITEDIVLHSNLNEKILINLPFEVNYLKIDLDALFQSSPFK